MSKSDQKRFAEIKGRLRDLRSSHSDRIDSGDLVFMSLAVVAEAEWLARKLDAVMKGVEEPEEELVPA